MADREKVLKGLKCCAAMSGDECRKCPYSHECIDNIDISYGTAHLAADALELLKENEVHNYGKIITVYGHDKFEDAELYRDICETLKDAGLLTIHRTEDLEGYRIGWKLMGVKKP